ncbi:MAG: lipid A biosynthesis acyltransferase [Chitinophagaceae bacterium]
MPSWQGKSRGTPFGYSIFVSILKSCGVLPAYLLLRIVVLYYFLFSFRASKLIFHYFHKKLHYNYFRSLGLVHKNYYRLGQTIIDKIVVMSGFRNRFTYHFDGEENLHKITAMGKGGLLLSAHLGNWEIAGYFLNRVQAKINVVMYDGEHQNIKKYLEGVTGKRNMNIIVIKEDLSHIYAISEALNNNELVAIHADRFLEGNKTMTANFLGEPALFPAGPFVLAATFKVPVSFVFAFKETDRHYHLYSSEIRQYEGSSKTEQMQQLLNDFTVEMERKAKLYPDQWFNYYNFWQA